jgi:hypothetical protein
MFDAQKTKFGGIDPHKAKRPKAIEEKNAKLEPRTCIFLVWGARFSSRRPGMPSSGLAPPVNLGFDLSMIHLFASRCGPLLLTTTI